MKQLELNVKITHNKKQWELVAIPVDTNDWSLTTYYMGDTYNKVVTNFLMDLTDHNVKYWYMLQDK